MNGLNVTVRLLMDGSVNVTLPRALSANEAGSYATLWVANLDGGSLQCPPDCAPEVELYLVDKCPGDNYFGAPPCEALPYASV